MQGDITKVGHQGILVLIFVCIVGFLLLDVTGANKIVRTVQELFPIVAVFACIGYLIGYIKGKSDTE